MSENDLKFIENRLAKIHGRSFCKLVGSGTTAIYLLLLAYGLQLKKVCIPNNVCMSVLLAICFSGNIPCFADIDYDTFGIDVDTIDIEDIDCIIGVHSYGNVCNLKKITKYCDDNNILFIEDAAVAQGISLNNKPIGSFGDASILSFGEGKIINIGHGGAILTDSKDLFVEVNRLVSFLDSYTESFLRSINEISSEYKKIYNIDFGKSFSKYRYLFSNKCIRKKNLFLYKFDLKYLKKLNTALDQLPFLIANRNQNASFLYEKFSNQNNVVLHYPRYGTSYWRFNLLLPKKRNALFRLLIKKKYNISSWYTHINDLFFDDNVKTPICHEIGNKILNIFVNEEIDFKYLNSITQEIINFFK